MSASSRPTSAPALRSAAAMLTATVDLPTPPLPDAIAIVCLTPGRISDGFGRMNAGLTLAVMRTSTPETPGMSPTRSWAWVLKRSRTGHAGVVSSNVKLTLPCGRTSSSLIMPRLTTSRPRSGSWMWARTSSTCWVVGLTAWMLPGSGSEHDVGPMAPRASAASLRKHQAACRACHVCVDAGIIPEANPTFSGAWAAPFYLVGQMAIGRFLGSGPLEERVGRTFGSKPVMVPLPHPSGQSRWLNDQANRERLDRALALLAKLRLEIG